MKTINSFVYNTTNLLESDTGFSNLGCKMCPLVCEGTGAGLGLANLGTKGAAKAFGTKA